MEKTDVTQYSVVVLAGGWSDEREISLQSGSSCAEALREAGFARVDVLDVADPDFFARMAGGNYDVAFVAMHGRYGEDGCVQGMLERASRRPTASTLLRTRSWTRRARPSSWSASGCPSS